MKDALETVHEITKLIKYSPRREVIFQRLKEDLPSNNPGIRVLCPTRWTVRAESIASVIKNFDVLQDTWEEASTIVKDLETKSRIRGVSAIMNNFDFVFGAMLGELVLGHADNLSSILQHETMSAAAGQELARMTVQTLESLRNDRMFDIFWAKVNQFTSTHEVNEARLPRQRKRPKRYEEGTSSGDFHETPKQYYQQYYFEAIDLIVNCIQDRFDQPGYKVYSTLESLLMKACKQEEYGDDLEAVCTFYKEDFVKELLHTQLQTFAVHFQEVMKEKETLDNVSFFDLKNYFSTISSSQAALLHQVVKVMQLILIMPATNASFERSFSALRRVKRYLRSTMLQERLNYLMLLHVHKDNLCLKTAINEFIQASQHRANIFAKYKI